MEQSDRVPNLVSLLGSMTIEEKIGQLTMIRIIADNAADVSEQQITGIRKGSAGSVFDLKDRSVIHALQQLARTETRLGIPLLFALDVLHGYRTIFPIPLGEAAAMNPALWKTTARAAANEAAADGISLIFAPMIDVSRDPRWGRMAESPGEDPWLVSRFAEAKVHGFQGDALRQGVAATAKHFLGYGAVTAGREYGSIDVSDQTLRDVYLPPFIAALQAGVAAIMPALSDLAGTPMTAHSELLKGLLRIRLQFDGVIISDFNAITELITHGVAADTTQAAALALNAGVDIDMASGAYAQGLPEALARGLVSEKDIDNAVARVLALKKRLGLFENAAEPEAGTQIGVLPDSARKLARQAAVKSFVLLKNKKSLLPLRPEPQSIVIAGSLASAPGEMLGPWRCAGKAEETISFLQGLQKALPGWNVTYLKSFGTPAAKDTISKAELFLLCLGEMASMSGEAASRSRPGLLQAQRTLFEEALTFGKPLIITLTSGRPIIEPRIFKAADAVLVTWFPGSEAGNALADILTGAVNPSGKLPVSWPCDVGQIPVFFSQRRTGRPANPEDHDTSKYIDIPVEPLFPFGHGLSYTQFVYRGLRVSSDILNEGEELAVEADIQNVGSSGGEETCFLFVRDPVASIARPTLELRGLCKLRLGAGEKGTAKFKLSSADLGFATDHESELIEVGQFEIFAGPSAEPQRLLSRTIYLSKSTDILKPSVG